MPIHNFSEKEKEIIKFWQDQNIFVKSVNKDAPQGDYVFYDGPPFATGLPHYGHIVASILKDVVPRYFTMKGFRVERVWGWDCHGLPIENIVEKELNLKSKKDIENLGVSKFNEACRGKVLTYAVEWEKVISRLGRFVDMEHAYKTMDTSFMESVWWVFKQLWDKELIYESYKSMHICPRCETTLSQSEVSEGYQEVTDLSVTVKFQLVDEPDTYVLSWTTTPWTLPGNVALAVGEDIDYGVYQVEDESGLKKEKLIFAKELQSKVIDNEKTLNETREVIKDNPLIRDGQKFTLLKVIKGRDLVGKTYQPLFDYFVNDQDIKNINNAYKIYAAPFVTTTDGTGVVHIAPAFGEDDMSLGLEKLLPFIQHVSMDGRFIDKVKDFALEQVKPKENSKQTDEKIVAYLKNKGLVFAAQEYEHSYPHCWRCDSPLLNYATSSWFVNIIKIKERMLSLAKNINWVPAYIKDGRFGNWLEGARDWSISRQRFWGSVLPIWKCQCGAIKVFGSIAELETASGQQIDDIHKDKVDFITVPCEKCGSVMHRIPDVLDCWFESGSMPYAQMHYPFENKEKFENTFPAQYIAEGVDQTRCWFYYLHALSTAIMDNIAYKNVIVNGIVLAEDGKKMSKRLKNYPDPMEVMDKYGADAMRLYLTSSSVVKAEDLCFSQKGVEDVFKKVIMIFYNVAVFYEMYQDQELLKQEIVSDVLDEWILARLQRFIQEVTEQLDAYDLMRASKLFADFVNDLSTWYVRRSRDRFKDENQAVRAAALQTLRTVMLQSVKVMAPFIPFITESVYLRLKNEDDPQSVHLCNWPSIQPEKQNQELLDQMQKLRQIVEVALSLRSENNLKIRQPLAELQIKSDKLADDLVAILKDELNVKNISFVKNLTANDFYKTKEFEGIALSLNCHLDESLQLEGLSRELARHLNLLRKEHGFTIKDNAKVRYFTTNPLIQKAIDQFQEMLSANTKIVHFDLINDLEGQDKIKINGETVQVVLEKE